MAMERCRSLGVSLYAFKGTELTLKKSRQFCKTWSCPRCAPRKAKDVSSLVVRLFKGYRCRHFVVTCRQTGEDSREAFKKIGEKWNALLTALRRKHGKFRYFRCVEATQGGWPHLHIIATVYIDQKELSQLAVNAGFGTYAYCREIKTEEQRAYTYKYLSKGFTDETVEHNIVKDKIRRWSCSGEEKLYPVSKKAFNLLCRCFDFRMCSVLVDSLISPLAAVGAHKIKSVLDPGGGSTFTFYCSEYYGQTIYRTVMESVLRSQGVKVEGLTPLVASNQVSYPT